MPRLDVNISDSKIADQLSAKKATITKLWNEGKTKLAWKYIRTIAGANNVSPPVDGLLDDDGVAHYDEPTQNKMTAAHIKRMFCKQPLLTQQGKIVHKPIFTQADLESA